MGCLTCFRHGSGRTCGLGRYQAFTAAGFEDAYFYQNMDSRYPHPGKCDLLHEACILVSLLNKI